MLRKNRRVPLIAAVAAFQAPARSAGEMPARGVRAAPTVRPVQKTKPALAPAIADEKTRETFGAAIEAFSADQASNRAQRAARRITAQHERLRHGTTAAAAQSSADSRAESAGRRIAKLHQSLTSGR